MATATASGSGSGGDGGDDRYLKWNAEQKLEYFSLQSRAERWLYFSILQKEEAAELTYKAAKLDYEAAKLQSEALAIAMESGRYNEKLIQEVKQIYQRGDLSSLEEKVSVAARALAEFKGKKGRVYETNKRGMGIKYVKIGKAASIKEGEMMYEMEQETRAARNEKDGENMGDVDVAVAVAASGSGRKPGYRELLYQAADADFRSAEFKEKAAKLLYEAARNDSSAAIYQRAA